MAEYKFVNTEQLEADLGKVGSAIRSKGGTTELLAFPEEMVSAIGAISTGVELNFDVERYSTEAEILAATPAENTIGIISTTEMTGWIIDANQPEELTEGMVWISVGTSSAVEFNALRKNGLQVYPLSAKQYISGACVSIIAMLYQGGEWLPVARLPIEYQEVEYIQTTGTQRIDTGIIPSDNSYQVSTKIVATTSEQNCVVFGCEGGLNYQLAPYMNTWYVGQNGVEGGFGSYPSTVGAEYEIDFNDANHNVIINGATICSGKTYTSTYPIKMAWRSAMTNASGGKYKYYYFKILNNTTGTVLMDLVPCYRRSDSVAGMYDLVSKKFFTNAGTGTFIVGGDV